MAQGASASLNIKKRRKIMCYALSNDETVNMSLFNVLHLVQLCIKVMQIAKNIMSQLALKLGHWNGLIAWLIWYFQENRRFPFAKSSGADSSVI